MKTHRIALVGRPNVGKSALFNRICGKRISIVDSEEGVTRDPVYTDVEFGEQHFQLIDLGGIDPDGKGIFHEEIQQKALEMLEEVDKVIFVCDVLCGMTLMDQRIAKLLLKKQKQVVLAVNKVDHPKREEQVFSFMGLGIQKIIGVSAIQGYQIKELLSLACGTQEMKQVEQEAKPAPVKLAILGRANVGKSTLFNALLEKDRAIVSAVPGTTRDSLFDTAEINGTQYLFIDTAGIRRKQKEKDVIEKFASIRTKRALAYADVILFVLDAAQGMTREEKKIIKEIEAAGKSCVILMNKWDAVKGFKMETCLREMDKEIPNYPVLFISAKTHRNLDKIWEMVAEVKRQKETKITTHRLNRYIETCLQRTMPPMTNGKRLKIYYIAQLSNEPPSFALFVNRKGLLAPSYKKYLINQFRKEFGFIGSPLVFDIRQKAPPPTN